MMLVGAKIQKTKLITIEESSTEAFIKGENYDDSAGSKADFKGKAKLLLSSEIWGNSVGRTLLKRTLTTKECAKTFCSSGK